MQTITMFKGNLTSESEEKMETKYSLNMFAISVLLFACILSLSFTFVETFPGMLETLDLVLKKDQKRFGL